MTKRLLAFVLICVGCGPVTVGQPEVEARDQPVSPTHCAAEATDVRSAPPLVSTSRVFEQLSPGDRVERVIETATSMGPRPDDYWHVRLVDGRHGYVASAGLLPIESGSCVGE